MFTITASSTAISSRRTCSHNGGQLKLTDFGIAKVFAATHLTATGGIVGTAEFLSPEQAAGKVVGKRSNLYCLGCVLYMLLTGRPRSTATAMSNSCTSIATANSIGRKNSSPICRSKWTT